MNLENLKHVRNVNSSWIYYDDGTYERANPEKLSCVLHFAESEEKFYNRFMEVIWEMSKIAKSEIDKMPYHKEHAKNALGLRR